MRFSTKISSLLYISLEWHCLILLLTLCLKHDTTTSAQMNLKVILYRNKTYKEFFNTAGILFTSRAMVYKFKNMFALFWPKNQYTHVSYHHVQIALCITVYTFIRNKNTSNLIKCNVQTFTFFFPFSSSVVFFF